jgi:hypothetical protein
MLVVDESDGGVWALLESPIPFVVASVSDTSFVGSEAPMGL